MPKNQGSTDLQLFALRLAQFLEVVIQAQLRELVLQVDPKVHVLDRVDDDVDELHAGHHELDVEHIKVHKVLHERLEAVLVAANVLEAVEGAEDDLVTAFDQADGGQQLQHQRLGAQALVVEAERDARDGRVVSNHQIEAVLVVHDGAQAHD